MSRTYRFLLFLMVAAFAAPIAYADDDDHEKKAPVKTDDSDLNTESSGDRQSREGTGNSKEDLKKNAEAAKDVKR